MLLIETSNESLLQSSHTYLYEPFGFQGEGMKIEGSIKVIEAKAPERNIYLNSQSTRFSGSYVTMRVPGTKQKLATFEYNSAAGSGEDKDLDESASWLNKLAQPLIIIIFMSLACYISFNSVKNKNAAKKGTGGASSSRFGGGSRKSMGGGPPTRQKESLGTRRR